MESKDIVIAITGASGTVYARRLVEELVRHGLRIHLIVSDAGAIVLRQELQIKVDLENFDPGLLVEDSETVCYHHYSDITAPVASGSFPIRAMVVVPCSMGTLGSIASGISGNLIERAADVTLKERRPLILVPRETPLNAIHLENMLKLARAGACIMPAMPAYYHLPRSISDQVDFIVGKILDQLGIENDLSPRWEGVE